MPAALLRRGVFAAVAFVVVGISACADDDSSDPRPSMLDEQPTTTVGDDDEVPRAESSDRVRPGLGYPAPTPEYACTTALVGLRAAQRGDVDIADAALNAIGEGQVRTLFPRRMTNYPEEITLQRATDWLEELVLICRNSDITLTRPLPERVTAYVPPPTQPPTTLPPPPPPNFPSISKAEFDDIQTGMSYDEVVGIIGSRGELISEYSFGGYTTQIFMWDGSGGIGANANVTFQNGTVVGKAQFGLG